VRRFGERRALLRVIVVWGITAVALHAFALVIPGVHVSGWPAAILGAGTIGLLNALVWPIFVRIALPITVLTLGFGALLCNGVFVYLGSLLVPGFKVDSIWSAVAVTVGLTLVNTVFTTLLAIDDDDFYYRQVVRRLAEDSGEPATDIPGVVFVQIDGLAHDVLEHAISQDDVSTVPDRRLTGGPPARIERRHSRFSLVRKGGRRGQSLQPSHGCYGDRAASFRRGRSSRRRWHEPGKCLFG